MKDRLKSFFIKQKPFIALFMGFVLLAASVAIGLRADATPMPTQTLSGTITSSQTLSPSYVYIVEGNVDVPNGVTLTIPAGTIIKINYGNITVKQGGSVRTTGTAASPVHFTSIKDDTVGGDTNGDGTSSSPARGDYYRALVSQNGDLNVVFTKFNYFSSAIDAIRTSGSIVITDSTFNYGFNAIQATAPTVKLYRNIFGDLEPSYIDGAVQVTGLQDLTKAPLSGIDQNKFTGTAKLSRIIRFTNVTLPSGKTWSANTSSGAIAHFRGTNIISGTVNFGSGTSVILYQTTLNATGTVNVGDGTIIKNYYGRLSALPGGQINVTGTAQKRAVFTNLKDDTVGGDTNGDGNTIPPTPLSANGIIYTESGNINVSFAEFSYFTEAIYGDAANVSITDTKFNKSLQAVLLGSAQSIVMQRNEMNVNPQEYGSAVAVGNVSDISGIDLSGADRNIFSGNARARLLSLRDATLPLGKTLDISSDSGVIFNPWESVDINGTLNINANSTVLVQGHQLPPLNVYGVMNISEGVAVKFDSSSGISVRSSGILNINGTVSNKVNFTSIKDDTVGGDTNVDAASSQPGVSDYNNALSLGGGSIYMTNANIKYAYSGIYGNGTSLKVFDSKVTASRLALDVEVPNVKIYRNEFSTVPDEYVHSSARFRGIQDVSRVGLSGNDQNFFTGQGGIARTVEFYNSSMPSGQTLAVSQSSGAVTRFNGWQNNIYGTVTMNTGTTLVLEGSPSWFGAMNMYGTLNIQQGAIVKIANSQGISLREQGKLNINGTSANKVKVTSYHDDSVGGDTNGNGANTSPEVGGAFLSMSTDSLATISNIDVKYIGQVFHQYSTKKLDVNGINTSNIGTLMTMNSGEAEIKDALIQTIQLQNQATTIYVTDGNLILRGNLSGVQGKAIEACRWNETRCVVDAAYVDWGTNGPTESTVCGQVTVSPWMSNGSAVNGQSLFTSKNCDGTPTPNEQLSSSTSHYSSRMAIRGIDCSNGFEDACQAMQTAQNCLGAATSLAASTSSFPLPDGNAYEQPAQWGNMLASNASTYIQSVEGPSPILSAAGFAGQLIGAVSTIMNVANAYNSCAP